MVKKITVGSITRTALMGALIFAAQIALASVPNIELVTLLIVVFTRNRGKEGIAACFVYVFLTSLIWGFGLWWATYMVVWPLFALVVYKIRRLDSWLIWAVIDGAFGLCFGAIFAVPYIFVSPAYALSYWISGIPFDVAHCIGNFMAAAVLGETLDLCMKRIPLGHKS